MTHAPWPMRVTGRSQRKLADTRPGPGLRPGRNASWSGRFWWVAVEQPGVADLLVRCLVREGVTVVFGIPGEENIRFTDALARFVNPLRAGAP